MCAHQSLGYDVPGACCAINAAVCLWERAFTELIAVDTLRSNPCREREGTGDCLRLFSLLLRAPLLGHYRDVHSTFIKPSVTMNSKVHELSSLLT